MKTIEFTMISTHLAIRFQQHFLSEAKQKATCKSMLEFDRLKPLQSEPHASKLTTKRVPNFIKNRSKSKPGSSVALFADPGDAWSLKMLTQGAKSESPDCKISSQMRKKTLQIPDCILLIIQYQTVNPARPASPTSPTVHQFTSLPIAEGAGGSGEALRSILQT